MSFSLPNPTAPTNGQPLDASPILANFVAIQAAIDSFDGSQVQAKSITEQALADAVNPRLRGSETLANFVYTGCVWSATSGLAGTMSGGTIYVNGYRVVVTAIGSHTFAASNDTYVDIDNLGNVTYNGVSNGSAAPSLTANSIRVAKVVTGGSTVSSVSTFGADSLGNILYPIGPDSAAKTQNPYKFSVYCAASPSLTASTALKVPLETRSFDTGANFDIATNHRFVAPVAGFYFFTGQATVGGSGISGTTWGITFLFKNGAEIQRGQQVQGSGNNNSILTLPVSGFLQLAANDYIELYAETTDTGRVVQGGSNFTFLQGFLVSAT